MIVVLGGDVDLESVKKQIVKIISSMKKGVNTEAKNYSVIKTPKESILKKETAARKISRLHRAVNAI